MLFFGDKVECVPLISSLKTSCRNYWNLKPSMKYMFFKSVCELLTMTVCVHFNE